MFIGVITFTISWLIFFIFSYKKNFPIYILTSCIGIILAFITDLLMFVYPLWKYPGNPLELFGIQLMNAFGIYFVVIYFFLQAIPTKQTLLTMARYIFYWSMFVIALEFIFIHIGFIKHGLWWNLGFSYAADWILFTAFYIHHKWVVNVVITTQYS
ncbi:CBO0543 family protein [Virgibacillus sp. W0181]|uniref:CBO0543 family protein n=1 Tax=Virgibacillus sp. W0181 TaxID=3391581 RepID=UPI003F47B7BF